jgi:general stress protein CsbA
MHRFPGYFISVLLELIEKPMSGEEIDDYLGRLERRMTGTRRLAKKRPARGRRLRSNEVDLDRDIALAKELHVLEEMDGILHLTPGGREIAEHVQEVIPRFMGDFFSPKTVSTVTIAVHVLLSISKLAFGFISHSAGLIADGIDNGMDTLSAVLVWLGIKFDKERAASLFIVVVMFLSAGGIAIASIDRIVNPGPVTEGAIALVVSALCGVVVLLLSVYQYTTGRKSSNLAIMCLSVDSRNHFLTSVLVCVGIFLSFLAESFHAFWLYYADAAASTIIGFLILKSAIELSIELVKPGGEPTHVSHFMKHALEKMKGKMISAWVSEELKEGPLTKEQLEERFTREFCEQAPRIFVLSGIGYMPESSVDLHRYLNQFVEAEKLVLIGDRYMLPTDS